MWVPEFIRNMSSEYRDRKAMEDRRGWIERVRLMNTAYIESLEGYKRILEIMRGDTESDKESGVIDISTIRVKLEGLRDRYE